MNVEVLNHVGPSPWSIDAEIVTPVESNPWSKSGNLLKKIYGEKELVQSPKTIIQFPTSLTREEKRKEINDEVHNLYQIARKQQPVVETKERGKTIYISDRKIEEIRFSQDSISRSTSDGLSLNRLTDIMKTQRWDKHFPINIIKMPDGKYTSLDNRRLYCAKSAISPVQTGKVSVLTYGKLTISAKIYDHSVRANRKTVNMMWNNYPYAEVPRVQGIAANTWGDLVIMRMNSGEIDTSRTPYGFTVCPTIR